MSKAELSLLSDAFVEFNKASESLVAHYASLERRIGELKNQIEQKNSQLEKAQAYLRGILESLPIGVVLLDDEHAPLFSNGRGKHLVSTGRLQRIGDSRNKTGTFKDDGRHYRWTKEPLPGGFEGREVLVIEDMTGTVRIREAFERDERE